MGLLHRGVQSVLLYRRDDPVERGVGGGKRVSQRLHAGKIHVSDDRVGHHHIVDCKVKHAIAGHHIVDTLLGDDRDGSVQAATLQTIEIDIIVGVLVPAYILLAVLVGDDLHQQHAERLIGSQFVLVSEVIVASLALKALGAHPSEARLAVLVGCVDQIVYGGIGCTRCPDGYTLVLLDLDARVGPQFCRVE